MTDDVNVSEGKVIKVWTDTDGVERFAAIIWDDDPHASRRSQFAVAHVDSEQRHLVAKGARFYIMSHTTYEGMPQYTTTRYVLTFIRPRP